jgi:hypothetical protein
MPDAPEIPEATTPFDKRVALSIAIIAVVLSFVGNRGDNAKTDAIIKTNEASDQWGYFQAKTIKGQMTAMHGDLLEKLSGSSPSEASTAEAARLRAESARYEAEKAEIKANAEALAQEAAHQSSVNDRCDLAALMLQIGVVVSSVAILSGWRPFWYAGLALGTAGTIAGVTAFLM